MFFTLFGYWAARGGGGGDGKAESPGYVGKTATQSLYPLLCKYILLQVLTWQRLLDESVYRGKHHIPPHFGLLGLFTYPTTRG